MQLLKRQQSKIRASPKPPPTEGNEAEVHSDTRIIEPICSGRFGELFGASFILVPGLENA